MIEAFETNGSGIPKFWETPTWPHGAPQERLPARSILEKLPLEQAVQAEQAVCGLKIEIYSR